MKLIKEGSSTSHPPLLDGFKYGYWKAHMMAHIKSDDAKKAPPMKDNASVVS